MTDKSAYEILEYLCWKYAHSASQFYPPDETASNATTLGKYTERYERSVMFFACLNKHGFDPVQMTLDYVEDSMGGDGIDLAGIDWTFLRESYYEGELPGERWEAPDE